MKVENDGEFKISLNSFKRNGVYILLFFILVFGFYLRVYHIDYPVVGYHNWKETHYLTEARNFAEKGFFEHGFFVPEYDYPRIDDDPSGIHSDSFPFISIFVAMLFGVFGESLIFARLVGILFNLGTIFVLFFLARKLYSNNDYFALSVAFLASILPLFVFFSRNVQLVNVGLFFMVVSLYYFVSWIKEDVKKYFYVSILFFILAVMAKYSFGIMLIPMFFMGHKRFFNGLKNRKINLFYPVAFAGLLVAWYIYSEFFIAKLVGEGAVRSSLFDPFLIFSSKWMVPMKSYIVDNYTMLGFLFFIGGIILLLINKKRTLGNRFLRGSLIAILVFLPVMAKKLQGHSYHQYPIAIFIVFFIAYFIFVITGIILSFVKKRNNKILKLIIVLLLIFVLINPSMESKNRQFDTQFIGLDVAGEYIKDHAGPGERMIHSGHQDYGVIWHAGIKAIDGGIPSVDKIEYAEENLNVSWIFVYQWGFSSLNDGNVSEYIFNNYRPVQVAFFNNKIFYIIFRKGTNETFSFDNLKDMIDGKPVLSREYEFSYGKVVLNYIDLEG